MFANKCRRHVVWALLAAIAHPHFALSSAIKKKKHRMVKIRRFCLFCVWLKHRTLGSAKNVGLGAGECGAEEGGWAVTGYWKALRGEGLRY